MKNKKAVAHLAIGSFLTLIFYLIVWQIVFEEVEPLIEEALLELDDSMVCPPEFSSADYEICISPKGEIVVNGILNEDLDLKLDSSNEICIIKKGNYENEQTCMMKDLQEAKNLYLTGMSFSKVTNGKKLLSYTKSGKYLRLLKFVKYLPK